MKNLSSNKSITVAELKEWLAKAKDSDTVSLEISPKWGSNVFAKLTECRKVGHSIVFKGFEK